MSDIKLEAGEALEIRFGDIHQLAAKDPDIRWHAMLPDRPLKKDGRDIQVSGDELELMAKNITNMLAGPKRPITLGHPNLATSPAVGWIHCDHARIGEYKGQQALYVGIEWLESTKDKIKGKEYAYLSPVYTRGYVDQDGQERGPMLLGAGLLNDPHWTDQTALWNELAATVAEYVESPAMDAELETDMPEKKPTDVSVVELAASLADRDSKITTLEAENTKTTEALVAANTQLEELKAAVDTKDAAVIALTARVDEVEKREMETKVETLVSGAVAAEKIHTQEDIKDYTELARSNYDMAVSLLGRMEGKTLPTVEKGDKEGTPISGEAAIVSLAADIQAKAKEAGKEIDHKIALKQARIELAKEV